MLIPRRISPFFFFNDPATTEIYTLSLHDALPICPHCMDAADEAAEPLERVGIVQFRGAPAAARIQRETKFLKSVQGARADCNRRHSGNLALHQFRSECVLLEDLRIAPARRPVELRDQGF